MNFPNTGQRQIIMKKLIGMFSIFALASTQAHALEIVGLHNSSIPAAGIHNFVTPFSTDTALTVGLAIALVIVIGFRIIRNRIAGQ